jgi:tetratricopeptide (TPR) repeat protein
MARNPFPLLVVGVLATLFFVPSLGDRERQLTPNEYVDRANNCYPELECKSALSDLKEAINLDPKLARAYVLRGSWTLKQQGSIQAALEDYRKARSLYLEQHRDFEAQEMTRRAIVPLEQGKALTCLPTNPIKPLVCL